MSKSVFDLTKEWRDQIVQRLDSLDEGHKEVSGMCNEIRLQLHKLVEIDGLKGIVKELENKVRSLEDSRLRAITVFAVVQAVLFIGWTIASKTVFK